MDRRRRPEPQGNDDPSEIKRASIFGYGWAALGVATATLLFRFGRGELDKEQAPLLYLPVVVACAIRLGFGPAVLAAAGSFICWNFFFMPPYGTWAVADPKDWLSLTVFFAVAIVTARLAAQARAQTQEARAQTLEAQARAREADALQRASEQISVEVEADRILPVLARQLVATCGASFCTIYRAPSTIDGEFSPATALPADASTDDKCANETFWLRQAFDLQHAIGFTSEVGEATPTLDPKAGVFAPLIADSRCRGVAHIGPRSDGRSFSRPQERMILALASHAAVALARQALSDEAAQAQALREADELKNTLLSLVSHELRTPLAAIKASASGLLQDHAGWDEPALEEALQAINEESDRLSGLVNKLLDLSRLEAGAWKPQWDWCDLLDVLGTALARLPERDGRRVDVSAAPDLPLVRADFVQMAQVMTNLLENAAKYAPPETAIAVTLRAAGNDVRVDVADGGAGIPPDQSEAVFARFHRLEQHRRGGQPGTGLGLAICRGIIEAHGGRIWLESALGAGAVFSFTLPRAARFAAASEDDKDDIEFEEAVGAARTHSGG